MKFFRRPSTVIPLSLGVFGVGLAAWAAMPAWIQNIDARSALESVIFRKVPLLGEDVTVRRPPGETIPALGKLIQTQPRLQDLYSLRALEEEQALDFKAAEADWKLYLQSSPAKAEAELALADFYHRRHRPLEEVSALSVAASMPAVPAEKFTPVADQRSWKAFERIFELIGSQALGKSTAREQYKAWIQRYPQEQAVYSRYFEFLLAERNFQTAQQLVSSYRDRFPKDQVFPTKASALLAYQQGAVEQGLAVYDQNFQPLWPDELLKNYFDLLDETHNLRQFLQQAHKALEQNPDDFKAASRVFHYYRHAGNVEAAEQALTAYRRKKESRGASWTAEELYTFARLLESAQRYPEASRYYFALYNSADQRGPEEALVGLANILLGAPEQPIRLGAGSLSMYRNIATMDTGPGYLNGILSLILNDVAPQEEYSKEETRAVPYFHRARAAELLALLDRRFPACEARAALHARLIEAYAAYGQDDAVIRLGREFLATFPRAAQRTQISLLMADVYEARNNTKEEFALYDALLKELASQAEGVPLGESMAGTAKPQTAVVTDEHHDEPHRANDDEDDDGASVGGDSSGGRGRSKAANQAFSLSTQVSAGQSGPRSPEYQQVLDQYLARLSRQHAMPEALAVLRRELDRNPDDPGLYERFARFLEQNEVGTEQEAVYKKAIQKFSGTSWYEKLARWYLRHGRQSDFQKLTDQVAQIFSGTELQAYLEEIRIPSFLSLAVDRYAHERFPHNLAFVHELLDQYLIHGQGAEREALLRQYWFEDEQLRNMYFEHLSRTGKLKAELEQLKQDEHASEATWLSVAKANPAAARFLAEAELWQSHFEEAAPALGAVASLYPADAGAGREASAVYRSLAYFNVNSTHQAVRIELNLLKANPANRDTLARIGDIYADRSLFTQAVPYWNRMPETEPGNASSYLEAATVFWDYYRFDDALRLLEKGRTRLHDDALYSYQAGAIYENKRDYSRAIAEYVKGAVAEGAQSASYRRVVQLAARRSTAAQVDGLTAKTMAEGGFAIEAIRLRADVLQAESRGQELAPVVESLVTRFESTEVLEQLDEIALQRGLNDVHCHILEREAALTADPVRKMQLLYALASFYESHKNLPAAEEKIESLYRGNPRILGVIRATVDFHWRNKQPQRAIAVLKEAAQKAYPELGASLQYEASRKLTEAGDYGQARKILADLLGQSPYNGEYLAALADTYARAADNTGLRDFYVNQIARFHQANFPSGERKGRIAALRRGLIPALTATKQYPEAVDQYIELINAYPDDESLSAEAAVYAQRHNRASQILSFYRKTVAASPQDPRWITALARLEVATEDYQAALGAYSQAIGLRPDRIDLFAARAALEERLLRFDEAAADYATLYQRTYHDPTWMEKEGEVRARQNQRELAVQALEAALLGGRTQAPSAYFEVAQRLEGWNLLSEARAEAEKGVDAAGRDLLADSSNHSLARLYVRVMARLRMQEAAFAKLESALNDAGSLPPWSKEGAKKGLDAVTDTEWRTGLLKQRSFAARSGMESCMEEMGAVVHQYFTPEEKQEFLRLAEKKNTGMTRVDAHAFLVPLAEKAELAEFQVRLMYEALQETVPSIDRNRSYNRMGSPDAFIELQTRRLRLADLGQQLEQLASARQRIIGCFYSQPDCLRRAADAFHLADKPEDELRVLQALGSWHDLEPQQRQRYFELLLARSPQTLVEWSGRSDERGNQAAEFLLGHGGAKLAQQALDSRSTTEPPVWKPAYTALAGLYFNDSSPRIGAAFRRALAEQSIGQRLRTRGDRNQDLSGDTWFYYASRYGEYLKMTRNDEAEDFLPAELEHTPAKADAYFDTADTFEEYGDWTHAVDDYRHVLELSPVRVDAHNRLAGIYWKQKQRDAAEQELKEALAGLQKKASSEHRLQNRSDVKDFEDDFVETAEQTKKMGMLPEYQSALVNILRDYVKFQGYSGLREMILAARSDPHDVRGATSLLLDLSRSSSDPTAFLQYFAWQSERRNWEAEPILRRLVEILREELNKRHGDGEEYAGSSLQDWEIKWMHSLLAAKQYDRLRDELHGSAKSWAGAAPDKLLALQLLLAAATGKIDSVLSAYRADSAQAPSGETLRAVATEIEEQGDKKTARKVLEYLYQREIDEHQLNVANMLGLAEIRIENGELAAGLELLHRMTLAAGNPFEAQDPAAAFLVRTGHANEAIPFLQELKTAMPWNAEYRTRLAQAKLQAHRDEENAVKELVAVAQDMKASYEVRSAAAKALAGSRRVDLGSRELNLIAGAPFTLAEANQPFFFAARLNAAARLDNASRIVLLRAALEEYPHADVPRVLLLRAAMQAGEYHVAVATMKPFLHSRWLDLNSTPGYLYETATDDDSEDEDAGESTGEDDSQAEAEFSSDIRSMTPSEKAEICEQVGLAFQKLGAFDEALSSLNQALGMHPAPVVGRRLKAEIRDVRRVLDARRSDRQRQPDIHDALEQESVVRPRLAPIKPRVSGVEQEGGHR